MIKVCISGLGRTGIEVAKVLLQEKDVRIVSALCSSTSKKVNMDLGDIIGTKQLGVKVRSSDNIESTMFETSPDVVIDFSTPEAVVRNAKILSKMKINVVVGTTGLKEEDIETLYGLTKKYSNAIVYAPNITLGVNVLLLLTNIASNILNDYDFHITEVHHKLKKDAPSGTAIKIARGIETGVTLSGNSKPEIPIDAVRAGGVVGVHKVMIAGEYDRLEITHESFSRKVFAIGALKAVRFIYKKVGFYEMGDVLELSKVLSHYLDEREVI